MPNHALPEPWLRGTLQEVPATQRAVVHALQLAGEDLRRWCGELTDDQLSRATASLPSVAFHLRHIAGSLDRLLTYAEGNNLSDQQLASLKAEMSPAVSRETIFSEVDAALARSIRRVQAFSVNSLEESRSVGKKQLPTTVAGLLVHVADHTQRHVGQAITTAKLVAAQRVGS